MNNRIGATGVRRGRDKPAKLRALEFDKPVPGIDPKFPLRQYPVESAASTGFHNSYELIKPAEPPTPKNPRGKPAVYKGITYRRVPYKAPVVAESVPKKPCPRFKKTGACASISCRYSHE